MNVIVFFHYSIENNIYSGFTRFYTYYQITNVSIVILISFALILDYLIFDKKTGVANVIVYGIMLFALYMISVLYWSIQVQSIVLLADEKEFEENLEKEIKRKSMEGLTSDMNNELNEPIELGESNESNKRTA